MIIAFFDSFILLARFLRSATLTPFHIPKSELTSQRYRYRPPTPKKRFLGRASLSHSHIPKSDSCGALRYRTPTSQKRFLRSASLSHSHIPKSDSCGALRYRPPNIHKSELLVAALRYRPLTFIKAIKVYCVCFKLSWRFLLV
jgi:hypothetical protein